MRLVILLVVIILVCNTQAKPKPSEFCYSVAFASASSILQHQHLSSAGPCRPSGIDQRNHGAVDHCEGQNSLGIERHVHTGPQCHDFINSHWFGGMIITLTCQQRELIVHQWAYLATSE